MIITKRQDVIFTDDGRRVFICDKSCHTTEIIKWSVLLGLFAIIFFWLSIGYWHAKRRIRKGQQPLRYHRWLAPKSFRQQNDPAYYNQQYNGAYGMQNYQEPPPLYNSNGMPPAYQPPPGGTKVAPQQSGVVGAAPAPSPPSQVAPQLPPPALI